MPDAAEVVPLVLELLHLDHLGKAVDALHERILHRRAHAAREGHELRRRERLVVKKNDQMLEEDAPDLRDRFFAVLFCEIDAADLRAERAGKTPTLHDYCSPLMLAPRMIEP